MRMNIGTTSTSCGIISVLRYTTKIRSRPRNRSRAKAYAASVDETITTSVPSTETTSPFTMNRPNGRKFHASAKLCQAISDPIALGGVLKTSSAGFRAVSSAQRNGARKNSSTTVSSTCEMIGPRCTRRCLLWCAEAAAGTLAGRDTPTSVVIVHPPFLTDELQSRDGHDDDEEHPCGGRRKTHLELLEPDAVQVHHEGLRAHARSSAGEDVRLDEDLERRDEGHRHREEHAGRQQRQHDGEEPPDRPRTVDRGGLHERAGHSVERGGEDEHVVAEPLPHRHHHHTSHGPCRRAQEVRRIAAGHRLPQSVDDAA